MAVKKDVSHSIYDLRGMFISAIYMHDTDFINQHIHNKRLINFQTKEGNTPLHTAIETGQMALAIVLIRKGADINIKNKEDKTPFELAVAQQNNLLVEEMFKSGQQPVYIVKNRHLTDTEKGLAVQNANFMSLIERRVNGQKRKIKVADPIKSSTQPSVKKRMYDSFLKGVDYLRNHYTERYNLSKLAQMLHMGEASFATSFKRHMGLLPLNFIKCLRMEKARNMLLHERVTVKEAAKAVGYKSLVNFYSDYKKMYGNTPLKDMPEIAKESVEERVQKAVQYIHTHYQEPFSATLLSEKFKLPTAVLATYFKRVTGMAAKKYHTHVKLLKARELILKYKKTARAAAKAVGYKEETHFHKDYKKKFHETPRGRGPITRNKKLQDYGRDGVCR